MDQLIRIVLVDDHPVVLVGLANKLAGEADIHIVGRARRAPEAIGLAAELNPDIVILGMSSGGFNRPQAVTTFKEKIPGARVIVFTIEETQEDLLEAVNLGASSFFPRDAGAPQMAEIIRQVISSVPQPASSGARNPETGACISVEFFLHSRCFTGQLSCPVACRLLDYFNSSGGGKPDLESEVVEIELEQNRPGESIPRSIIEFVALADGSLRRGFGSMAGWITSPVVPKSPVPVQLETPGRRLAGKAYLTKGQSIQDMLNGEERFIPLTDVTIDQNDLFLGTRPFVAVNKQHINSIRREATGTALPHV